MISHQTFSQDWHVILCNVKIAFGTKCVQLYSMWEWHEAYQRTQMHSSRTIATPMMTIKAPATPEKVEGLKHKLSTVCSMCKLTYANSTSYCGRVRTCCILFNFQLKVVPSCGIESWHSHSRTHGLLLHCSCTVNDTTCIDGREANCVQCCYTIWRCHWLPA